MYLSGKKTLLLFLLFYILFNPISVIAQSALDLTIHYIEGVVSTDNISHDVSVFLSVVDKTGIPVEDLRIDDFSIKEDSRPIELDSIDLATDEPINVILLLDTSGSMARDKIISAKAAAVDFISGLTIGDQVAILTFNHNIESLVGFTSDFENVKSHLESVSAINNAGTCLYDATYQAVELASTLPTGRRAIILLTDGIDRTYSGEVCSIYTIEDVIDIATEGATRVPIYTIGLGQEVDEVALGRIATRTGGWYLFSPEADELSSLYNGLLNQLKTQYLLKYNSKAAPGVHTLTVEVGTNGTKVIDTRSFILPVLPTSIQISLPGEDQELYNLLKIQVSVISQGEQVNQVVFEVNGQGIGAVKDAPYNIEWDLSNVDYGPLTISAIAQGENFEEIARDSVTIVHLPPATEIPIKTATRTPPTIGAIPSPSSEISGTIDDVQGRSLTTLLWILGPLVLLIMVVGYFITQWKKNEESNRRYGPEGTLEINGVSNRMIRDATYDEFPTIEGEFGTLTVIYSDDPAMINQVFVISKPKITIGRSAENDFVFPKDNPVSRYHAVIELLNKQLVLCEIQTKDKSGNLRLPKFGTFIKSLHGGERQISTIPEALKPGDEIRLGNRTTLKFTASIQHVSDLAETLDEFDLRGNDDDLSTLEVRMD